MTDYLAPFKLLKEARKSWDYFLSDELVYAIQDRDVIFGGRYGGCLEAYLNGSSWVEMCFKSRAIGGNPGYNFWLIERRVVSEDGCTAWRDDEFHGGGGNSNESVISLIRQLSEDGKQVSVRPIPSIVRLHPFNFREGFGQNIENLTPTSRPVEFGRVPDGELSVSRRFTTGSDITHMLAAQFPSDVIQGLSETASEIRSDRPPRIGRGGRPTQSLPPLFIYLGEHLEGCGFIFEDGDTSLEAYEMLLRPVTLQPSMIQRMRSRNHE